MAVPKLGWVGSKIPIKPHLGVHGRIPESSANLPIYDLTLPSSGSDQTYRHSCLQYVLFSNVVESVSRWRVRINEFSDVDRLVYCSLTNHSDETSFPFLVYLVIIRDKHFVSLRSGHHLHPVAFRGRSGLPPRRFLPADDCSYASRFGAPPGLFGTQQHASQGCRALQSTSENATSW